MVGSVMWGNPTPQGWLQVCVHVPVHVCTHSRGVPVFGESVSVKLVEMCGDLPVCGLLWQGHSLISEQVKASQRCPSSFNLPAPSFAL